MNKWSCAANCACGPIYMFFYEELFFQLTEDTYKNSKQLKEKFNHMH